MMRLFGVEIERFLNNVYIPSKAQIFILIVTLVLVELC
jgi:hypothetical protein